MKVFAADGQFSATLGQQGQGPGDFRYPVSVAAGARSLVVADGLSPHLTVFSLETREFTESVALPDDRTAGRVRFSGVPGEYWAAMVRRGIPSGDRQTRAWELVKVNILTKSVETVFRTTYAAPTRAVLVSGRTRTYASLQMRQGEPQFVVDRGRHIVYVAHPTRYEIVLLAHDGTQTRMISSEHTAMSPTEADRREALIYVQENISSTATMSDINWPAVYPAIDNLAIDEFGNLFVYEYEYRGETKARQESNFKVTVYSPDGSLAFTGTVDIPGWAHAKNGSMLGIETSDASEERVVATYRAHELRRRP